MAYIKRNCDNKSCKKEYLADERNLKRGWGLTCSKSCAALMREKAKPNYNPERVEKNNVRRVMWNENGNRFGNVSGHTSEGYRIINGVAYDEFDCPVYNVDTNEDAYGHGQWND